MDVLYYHWPSLYISVTCNQQSKYSWCGRPLLPLTKLIHISYMQSTIKILLMWMSFTTIDQAYTYQLHAINNQNNLDVVVIYYHWPSLYISVTCNQQSKYSWCGRPLLPLTKLIHISYMQSTIKIILMWTSFTTIDQAYTYQLHAINNQNNLVKYINKV